MSEDLSISVRLTEKGNIMATVRTMCIPKAWRLEVAVMDSVVVATAGNQRCQYD